MHILFYTYIVLYLKPRDETGRIDISTGARARSSARARALEHETREARAAEALNKPFPHIHKPKKRVDI